MTVNLSYNIFILFIISVSCTGENSPPVEDIVSPAINNGAQPYLLSTGEELFLSWQEAVGPDNFLKYSRFTNESWTDPVELASGKNWFINWADFPSLAVNSSGEMLAHYLPKSGESTYAYDINIILSNTGNSFKLHDDTTKTEHGFMSSIALEDNKFLIAWLDGRNTVQHGGAMNLRAAIVNSSGKKENEWLLDEKVCDCCQTSVAMTNCGPIIAYRDRSDDEVRDIVITRFQNNSWSSPEKVGDDQWKINGCPVNGPKIVSSGENVAIAWYTGKADAKGVKLVISNDSGRTFSQPVIVDGNNTQGRVDVVIDEEENVWVSYISTDNKDAVLKASGFNKSGKLLDQYIIGSLKNSRQSGFPQMEIFKKNLYFAWTDKEDPNGITIKRLSIN